MYGAKSNTKINSPTNKVKRRSVGTNTDDNFRCTNCMNCFEDINNPKIYFVPYIPCMNNPCFQSNMARTINACKCKCSSQTNVHDHKIAFQCSKLLQGNHSSLPPWEKHIGDNNERVPNTCQTDRMKHITKKVSKNNLSASNSVPSVNVNKLKRSHIPQHTLRRKTGNRLSNNLIDVERHASELFNDNSGSQISDRVIENEDENSDELIDEDSKIYKLLVPSFRQGSDMDENDENCSASENEEAEEENTINFRRLNRNQPPDEAMLMMMEAFVSDQSETKRDSKLSKLLNQLVPPGFVGESSNENRSMGFPFRKK